jgi:hypothetical protein
MNTRRHSHHGLGIHVCNGWFMRQIQGAWQISDAARYLHVVWSRQQPHHCLRYVLRLQRAECFLSSYYADLVATSIVRIHDTVGRLVS